MTPTLLLILDGWGLAAPTPGNAPYLAPTPNLDDLNARCPHAQLTASGRPWACLKATWAIPRWAT